jgi:hypothetical protein
MKDDLARVLDLTDALLAATRPGPPDLTLVQALLQERGELLARLSAPSPDERPRRLAALRRIQAADAELRSHFAERHAIVRDALRAIAVHGSLRRAAPARSRLVDWRA